jgi:hypothetical protein
MSAEALLAELQACGVKLWTDAGVLRYKARPTALTPDLLARLKAFKSELLTILTSGVAARDSVKPSTALDPAAAYRRWRIYYADRKPVEVAYTPAATYPEVMEFQRGAIAAKPIGRAESNLGTPAGDVADLSAYQSDYAEREARAAIARAAARVTCQECAIRRPADGVCSLAIFGGMPGARDGHVPDPATPRCCAGYVPTPDATDQRPGTERWPHLAARWPHYYRLRADQ